LFNAESRASFRVIVENPQGPSASLAVRNTLRLPEKCTVQIERAHGLVQPLAGVKSAAPAVVKSRRAWLIPVPPTATMERVVLGGPAPEISVVTRWGAWKRRITSPSGAIDQTPNQSTFLCLLDVPTRSYAAALQGPIAPVTAESSLVFEEEWTLAKRGR
jgi:hypothetical protein